MSRNPHIDFNADPMVKVILSAQSGNNDAREKVWVFAVPIAVSVARRKIVTGGNCRRPTLRLDPEDLAHDIMLKLDLEIRRFDVRRKIPVAAFLQYRFGFIAIDILRVHDPLGMQVPRRHSYPTHEQWRPGEESHDLVCPGLDPHQSVVIAEAMQREERRR